MNSVVRSKDNKPKSRRNDEVRKAVKHIEDDFRTERIVLSATTLLIKKKRPAVLIFTVFHSPRSGDIFLRSHFVISIQHEKQSFFISNFLGTVCQAG